VRHAASFGRNRRAAAAAACGIPIAYIGAEKALVDLSRFKQVCPQLKVAQTLGSGHFSPLIVPEQINSMLQGFERAYLGVEESKDQ
jgi:hypothetical protein